MPAPTIPNLTEITDRAVKLAKRGTGLVEPNPRVGALVLRGTEVVAEGFHREYGDAHAEVMALKAAGERARGADLFVTLEPCSTVGKTEACTQAIIATGIRRVLYACPDPNPRNGGQARKILESAGIEVVQLEPSPQALELVQDFKGYVNRTLPWVILKWAMTADGKIATVAGDSRWISSEDSRREGHEERRRSDAVLVGRATVKMDDPELTVRMGVEGRNPTRVIFDSGLHLDPASKVALTAAEVPTWVLHAPDVDPERKPALEALRVRLCEIPKGDSGRIDPVEALRFLRKQGLHRILVEGGPTVHGALFAGRLADWARIYVAPLLVGGITAPGPLAGAGCPTLEDAVWLSDVRVRAVSPRGSDLVIEGRITNHRES
jgi:diaminohydroxyphosphoribosylaminopyrimidine deaminase/5-amino-6-(5-phosphoribosylamino)uracil reductase